MFYQELGKLPDEVLTKDYIFPDTTGIGQGYWHINAEFFNEEITSLLSKCSLEISGGELFKKSPGKFGGLHKDVIWDTSTSSWASWGCAINIDIFKTKSTMYWVSTTAKPIYPSKDDKHGLTGVHYRVKDEYNLINNKECTVLGQLVISKPTLVKTNVIHSVRNLDVKDRWCISMRFKGNPSFEECAERLKEYI